MKLITLYHEVPALLVSFSWPPVANWLLFAFPPFLLILKRKKGNKYCMCVTACLCSMNENTIEVQFDLTIEPIVNHTDVWLLYGQHSFCMTVKQKRDCISVHYKICTNSVFENMVVIILCNIGPMCPLLLITRTYEHVTVCVFKTA
jgi:hypothetical protein